MFDILLAGRGEGQGEGEGEGPLYMKLYRRIRSLIEDGTLPHGARLPSVRTVQQQLRLSKTTVETAYQMLVAEGYVYSKPKSGFVVVRADGHVSSASQHPDRRFAASVDGAGLEARPLERDASSNEAIIDFNLLHVDKETFPAKVWRSALTEALDRHKDRLHEYGDARGEYSLREAVAQYLKASRGVRCEPEQVLIGAGISYSLHVLKLLLGEAGRVAYEQESIAQVGHIFSQHGFEMVPAALADRMLAEGTFEQLPSSLQAVYVTPSHRPAGSPLTNEMKERLLGWAADNGAFIIEDDYDGEFQFRGRPVPALQGADRHDVVVYIGTFSKAFTPALRMNYMVLPRQMLPRLDSVEYLLSGPSRMDQLAMRVLMERGHWHRHLKRIRSRYRAKQETLMRLIESELAPFVEAKASGAGLQLELTVHTGQDSETLAELALRAGVQVYAPHWGDAVDKAKPGGRLYLGFGGIADDEMKRGVRLLKEAWLRT